jgi:Zn-dependent peptidase ImmA (M78 family)/DNA-binding XRE family transcriptional regulator
MFATRLKQLRLARGFTLDGLAGKMGGVITKQALSKYEKGIASPSPAVLTKLAEALSIKSAELFQESTVIIELLAYRKRAALLKRDKETIESLVKESLEERIRLQSLVQEQGRLNLPVRKFRVDRLEDAEKAADLLRKQWKLGEAPIANVITLLEDQLVHVFEIDTPSDKFDGISALAFDEERVLKGAAVISRNMIAGERQRLNTVHELGHLVLDVAEEVDEEKAAFRFAGAFLAPASMVYREVGRSRSSIQLKELLLLKKRFGMSIQALLFRLRDLGIINDSVYKWSCIQVNRMGMRKKEAGEMAREEPQWLKRNVLRAVSEGVLPRDEAERLLGEPLEEEHRQFLDRNAFMKLPVEERRKILEEQAKALKKHYDELVEQEVPGGGDFFDY